MTNNSFHSMYRNAPDAEKAKYMVYAESIEIIAHLHETLVPPFKAVSRHFFPVVCGESPVLALDGEIVWRCSCLHFQMKQFGISPGVTAITINSNRYISF